MISLFSSGLLENLQSAVLLIFSVSSQYKKMVLKWNSFIQILWAVFVLKGAAGLLQVWIQGDTEAHVIV